MCVPYKLESSVFVGETVQERDVNEWKQCVCVFVYIYEASVCVKVYTACFVA